MSFLDPADDTWIERHLQDHDNILPSYNTAANRRPLPQNLFLKPTHFNEPRHIHNQSERTNRREALESVFLGQPISNSYMTMPAKSSVQKPMSLANHKRGRGVKKCGKQNLLSRVCFHCGQARMSVDLDEKAGSWSCLDVDTYRSEGELHSAKRSCK